MSAIFPGNRIRRLKTAGFACIIFIAAVIASPEIERAAEASRLADAGVSSREELVAIQAQRQAENEAANIASYVERLESQIASVRALSAQDFTDSFDSIMRFPQLIDGLAQLIEEGHNFALTLEQDQLRQGLRQALSLKQAEIFPILRDSYGPILRERLWVHDGYARTFGSGYRRVEIVNVAFAANRNIAEFHETVRETLLQLRFTRVDYKWFREAPDYSYFTLEPPADDAVGRWQETRFFQVE